jgi:hypothetical protein
MHHGFITLAVLATLVDESCLRCGCPTPTRSQKIKGCFMQRAKRTISTLLYFIFLSSLTNLAFIVFGIVLLSLFSDQLSGFGLQIIIFLILWKGALVGFLSWFWHKKANNKDFLTKFIGIYLGRFFGIFIGGFLGAKILNTIHQSEIIGFIVGALAFYFVGRWVGAKISFLIGKQLDKVFFISETQEVATMPEAKLTNRSVSIGFILYGVALPFLLVISALLMIYIDVPVGYFPELLRISRIVVIVLSIFSIGSPWLLKNRWLNSYQIGTSSPNVIVYWLGLILSVVPVIYGFVLFIAMGASIFELCIYAVISFIAAILWSTNNGVFGKQNAG